ncbi:uncharacterized protein N7525_003301 [Penicillium rubens]|uniref:uncharacterized protein n=1 Tax=Penicillium rubens TaxID=1108849 RepID=UPI002A5AEF20|nr:uncharacterized protein N7525_003301 [Penicillium rubens]KAJ5838113.1 hypothetical protein N7525_003301 [Penicillium rubens]KAJ5866159.1 hypothetical protein N7534_000712 [Penicillium rubens]
MDKGNFSSLNDPSDPLFHVCWGRQSCSSCLTGDVACSWCAISSTCVPNPSRVPIFAPFGSENICPLGAKEKWELRALPFGCHASTLTVVSVMGAVLAILALGVVGVGLVWLVRRTRWRWRETEYERADEEEQGSSRWRGWILGVGSFVGLVSQSSRSEGQTEVEEEAESRPLLE